jgi:hypothetical protein
MALYDPIKPDGQIRVEIIKRWVGIAGNVQAKEGGKLKLSNGGKI